MWFRDNCRRLQAWTLNRLYLSSPWSLFRCSFSVVCIALGLGLFCLWMNALGFWFVLFVRSGKAAALAEASCRHNLSQAGNADRFGLFRFKACPGCGVISTRCGCPSSGIICDGLERCPNEACDHMCVPGPLSSKPHPDLLRSR